MTEPTQDEPQPALAPDTAAGGIGTYRPLVGLLGLLIPQILSSGYGWTQLAADRGSLMQIPLWIVIVLPVAKIVATALSIGTGGSGGYTVPESSSALRRPRRLAAGRVDRPARRARRAGNLRGGGNPRSRHRVNADVAHQRHHLRGTATGSQDRRGRARRSNPLEPKLLGVAVTWPCAARRSLRSSRGTNRRGPTSHLRFPDAPAQTIGTSPAPWRVRSECPG